MTKEQIISDLENVKRAYAKSATTEARCWTTQTSRKEIYMHTCRNFNVYGTFIGTAHLDEELVVFGTDNKILTAECQECGKLYTYDQFQKLIGK